METSKVLYHQTIRENKLIFNPGPPGHIELEELVVPKCWQVKQLHKPCLNGLVSPTCVVLLLFPVPCHIRLSLKEDPGCPRKTFYYLQFSSAFHIWPKKMYLFFFFPVFDFKLYA